MTLRVPSRPASLRRGLRHGLRRGAPLAALALVAGACMPAGSTSQARDISGLYQIFFWAGAVVFAIVAGLVSYSIVRFRVRRPLGDGEIPPQYHSNRILEIIWTGLPILTVLALFGGTMVTLGAVQAKAPASALNVHVTAFQWQWQFEYPDANVRIVGTPDQDPVLVVPVGRTVHVTLTSADVNHAFFVPAFLFKMDAIPGHVNQFNFTVDNAGTYRGQCAEFCGVYHDRMIFSVKAVSQSEFDSWLSQQSKASPPPGGVTPLPSPTSVVSPSPSAIPSSS